MSYVIQFFIEFTIQTLTLAINKTFSSFFVETLTLVINLILQIVLHLVSTTTTKKKNKKTKKKKKISY